MPELRLDNSIFLMYLASEAYKKLHNISSEELLELNDKYNIFSYVADCPAVFDCMTEPEMAREIDDNTMLCLKNYFDGIYGKE